MSRFYCSFLIPLFLIISCGKNDQSASKSDSTRTVSETERIMDSLDQRPADLQPVGSATMLAYRFTKGEAFTYTFETKTHVEQQTDTIKQVSDQDLKFTYDFQVIDFDEALGISKLKATCIKISFRGKYDAREFSYDSDSPLDKMQERMFAQYNAPLRQPFRIDVASDGTIKSISDVEKIVERLMGNDYKTAKFETKKRITEEYANNTIKDQLQLLFQKLPEKPVATDSVWNITWEGILGFLKVRHIANYQLNGIRQKGDERIAHIGIKMKSQYVGPKMMETEQGQATVEQFDVRGSGSSEFDLAKTRTRARVMQQEVSTAWSVVPPEELKKQIPNLGTIRMSQRANVSTKVEEIR